ncbi:hypothetical protein PYCC9005_004284 [Savitreella phatthalungensis]
MSMPAEVQAARPPNRRKSSSRTKRPKARTPASGSAQHTSAAEGRRADEQTPLLDRQLDEEAQRLAAEGYEDEDDTAFNKRRTLYGIALLLIILALSVIFFVAWPWRDIHGLVVATHGAVATELEECSKVGVKILKKGGNAMDAGIAAALCIGTINSFSSGIGGGGFLIYRPANTSVPPKVINFRETAPAAAHKNMYHHNQTLSKRGGLSVGVPGEIRGYETAHKMFGKLAWHKLFSPSIRIARNGIATPLELANRLQLWGGPLLAEPSFAEIFAPTGELLKPGETLRREAFADTLQKIAKHGSKAFYEGEIAHALVSFVREHGGILSMEDMRHYEARVEEPLKGTYRGRYDILTCDSPSNGIVLLEALNILERLGHREGHTVLGVHRLVEAMKWMAAGRTELGDPFFVDNRDRQRELMGGEFASSAAGNTSDGYTHPWQHYNPKYERVADHGTTHISAIDEEGNAVSITTTVNLIFGSGLLEPTTGIILNDEQDDFSIPGTRNAFGLEPSIYNYIAPGKRSLSSQTPTIVVENGTVRMSLGGSGGSRIVTAVLEAIVKRLDWGFDLRTTIESPRVHHQLLPDVVSVEDNLSRVIKDGLLRKGHILEQYPAGQPRSEIQAVEKLNGKLYAMSDPRKRGYAAGY